MESGVIPFPQFKLSLCEKMPDISLDMSGIFHNFAYSSLANSRALSHFSSVSTALSVQQSSLCALIIIFNCLLMFSTKLYISLSMHFALTNRVQMPFPDMKTSTRLYPPHFLHRDRFFSIPLHSAKQPLQPL